jgi:hypothetical protein
VAGDGETKEIYEAALKKIFGLNDDELALFSLSAGSKALQNTMSLVDSLNYIVQSVNDCKPKNAMEARLAIQSSVLFNCAMNTIRKGEEANSMPQAEYYTNKAMKMLRLHNETIITLQKLRSGGEQKVTVTHAVITEKAIVNNFNGGGDHTCQGRKTTCKSQNAEQKQKQIMGYLAGTDE